MNSLFRHFICLALLAAFFPSATAQVVISELMASNGNTLVDEDGDYSDWIEINNRSAVTVNLENWSLTDSTNQPAKWRFPAVTLLPNSYLVVFASGKNRAVAGKQLHANFALDSDGEYLGLYLPDGKTVAYEFAPTYPKQYKDYSYGLAGNSADLNYFVKASPGQANGTGLIAFVADTKFSVDRGFYDAPFDLVISCATTNATIYFTTNGTPPAPTNGVAYTGPIRIDRTSTIRAAAFATGYQPSNVDTMTYIFLDDVIRQSANGQAPPGWPASWGQNTVDYGMDPDVVNNALYRNTITNDLKSLPSFSIVTDLKNLFNASTGIYANPGSDGRDWERPCSVELIYPDGTKGFQINAGVRIRGGFSRSTSNPKHALRLFFREEYGASKLKYPLFGDNGTDTFDAIDLRTFQNYSWSFQGDSRGIFVRDQFSRDAQLAMGHQAERGEYYHLYINGQYWGLYNTCERPEASYAATYYGGNKDDYDVIKVEAGPYTINATDGNLTAWTRLYNAAKAGLTSNDAYFKVQGRNPDGTINPAYENLVDVENMIDYMLIIIYGGNLDAPISNFLSNQSPNNWYGIRNRTGTEGFRFFVHDAEHTLLDAVSDRTGPYPAGDTSITKSSPQWVWQKMWPNPEFRILCADRIYKHFFNGGVFDLQTATNMFLKRISQIDRAVVGESARWGDAKRGTPFTRNDWVNAVNSVRNSFFPSRANYVVGLLRGHNLYPNIAPPVFPQHGGIVQPGFQLTMTTPTGTVYYTIDGSDPRLIGGSVSPAAKQYQTALTLNETTHVKARVLSGSEWSAVHDATFTLAQTFTNLLITEIMYHPAGEAGADADDFEFVELKNTSRFELDLTGLRFTNGIRFDFPDGFKLAPGRFFVLAGYEAGFTNRYPGVQVDGVFSGHLSDSGEALTLAHVSGVTVFSVDYKDKSPWPETADGSGFSLVPRNPDANPAPDDPANWRASSRVGGSPGADDPPVNISTVVVNEILTHADPIEIDAVELHNPNSTAADVSNWYLTDDKNVPKKFHIPAGKSIPAGGYLVFTEQDFNPTPGVEPSFSLSSHGEEIYLFSGDAGGNLTGYVDGFSFGAAENGVTFGRYTNSVGEIQYPPQISNTLGHPNSGPRVGPVVINEIHYNPTPGNVEFIELKNITGTPVKLYHPLHPTNTWRINGIGFEFPSNVELAANGLVVVAAGDPDAFRAKYGVPANVPVFGPFDGTLQNSGETLQVLRPDSPDTNATGVVTVPYVAVDEVRYDNRAPWPTEPDGTGPSLERIKANAYGNDPINWHAGFNLPSPGIENDGNRSPVANAGADIAIETAVFPAVANLSGNAVDDGLPKPPGKVSYQWSQVSGQGTAVFAQPNQAVTTVSLPGVGVYVLRLTADDGELQGVSELKITVSRKPIQATLVATGSVWKYLDNGSDQGTTWRSTTFNDLAWQSGKAQLGYGDGDEATVIGYGPNSANKYVTTYFRKTFSVTNAKSVTQLTVRLQRDDGAIVYLNGTEVFRSNMGEGNITFSTYASNVVGDADEAAFFDGLIDQSLLREGENLLAVELHQANASSSDLSFDLELLALIDPANQPPVVNAGPDLQATLPAVISINGSAADDGLPVTPGKVNVQWLKISGPGTVSFDSPNSAQTIARFDAPGDYLLRLTATDGELGASDDVAVHVVGNDLDAWRQQYFTAAELANPAVSGDAADPDGDGMTNFSEYVAGTNPRDSSSRLAVEDVATDDTGRLTLWVATVPGKTYSVQYRDSILGDVWLKLTDITGPVGQATVPVTDLPPSDPAGRYYRVITPRQ